MLNIEEIPLLSLTIFFPVLGALAIMLFAREKSESLEKAAKVIALITTILTLIISLCLLYHFDPNYAGFQFEELVPWIKGYDINYRVGVDGISIYFVILTTLLMPICILCSWKTIDKKVSLFMVSFLIMETLMIGVFAALDFVLFYLFFEAVLIPMFLIIGVWGGDNRIYAAFKFFLYTLVGSVLLLIAMIYIYVQLGTTDIVILTNEVPKFALSIQKWLWLAFFASFAVKVPMWPFHTWLPDAHVQAPTAGSVILAGVLLKIGGYGFLRFSLPMLPEASHYYVPFVFILSVVAIIYTSLVALMQEDMKKLIAYSSVAHMGFVTLGIFTYKFNAIDGAIFQMISHGIVSAALFLCVGVVYDRMHTKEIKFYGGLVNNMPRYAVLFMIFTMASIGFPGTSGFVGEFLILLGTFGRSKFITMLAATGVVLGAAYMLWLYRKVVFGEMTNKKLKNIKDIDIFERFTLIPLAIIAILIGVYPSLILKYTGGSVNQLIKGTKFMEYDAGPSPLGNLMIDPPLAEEENSEQQEEMPQDEQQPTEGVQ